jgi:WXG100 family type VII secretion target
VSKTGVDPAALERVASNFDEKREQIKAQLKIITDAVERTRPAWQGNAGMGFQTTHQMWGEQQERIIRLLTETATSIRQFAGVSGVATQEAADAVKVTIDLPLDNKTAGA